MQTLDEYVPKDQRNDIQDVKAWKRLTEQYIEHPWLQAQQTYQKNYSPVLKSKKKKPARKDSDIVNIDGKKQTWRQFKAEWTEDLSEKTSNGELIKKRTFIMNQDKKNEKLLTWHYKNGYTSEDSDDPTVVRERFERQFQRKMQRDHGEEAVYLQKRKLLPFEVLMLEELGGRQILEDLCGKKLPKKLVAMETEVYLWTDTSKKFPYRTDDFLKVQEEAEFERIYGEEKDKQLRAMG